MQTYQYFLEQVLKLIWPERLPKDRFPPDEVKWEKKNHHKKKTRQGKYAVTLFSMLENVDMRFSVYLRSVNDNHVILIRL